jgi:hypothetical protein
MCSVSYVDDLNVFVSRKCSGVGESGRWIVECAGCNVWSRYFSGDQLDACSILLSTASFRRCGIGFFV